MIRLFALALVFGSVVSNAQMSLGVDIVNGKLINFQPDGAWSWYQDERVILSNGKIVVGSVAAKREGDLPGGSFARDPGDVVVSTYDFDTGRRSYFELNDSIPSNDGSGPDEIDDHNAPSFLSLPDGRVLASYTGHSSDNYLRFRTTASPSDTSSWTPETLFTRSGAGVSGENDVSYTNLHYLPNEGSEQGRVYNFFRNQLSSSWDRHFAYSDDLGNTWQYGGQLTGQNAAAVRPYTKFVDDGAGRIYYTTTEDNSGQNIWVGYVENGKTHRLDGTVVDENLFDTNARPVNELTSVMFSGTELAGVTMTDLWTRDIALDASGHPVVTFRGYANGNSSDSRHIYARWNGSDWTISQVAIGGASFNSLDASEQAGSGQGSPTGSTINSKLAVLDPNDPSIVYFSSQFDPITEAPLISTADGRPHFEMFKATTADGGASWAYEQLTENSSVDNIRPTAAKTSDGSTVVLWMRGGHDHWDFSPGNSRYAWDTAIVGLVQGHPKATGPEATGPINYVDADLNNTSLASGSPWSLGNNYSSNADPGDADGVWHFRNNSSFGNRGTLFTANERSPYDEDNEVLRTSVTPDEPGLYDVWVTFWSPSDHPDEWRLQATLDFDGDGDHADEQMIAFERFGSQASEIDDFVDIEKVAEDGNRHLYRGYLGRVAVGAGESLDVFVDDLANTNAVSIPGISFPSTSWRTWYDGIGYALVGLQGDYNRDGFVNAADYTVWRSALGSSDQLADGDLNGIVDENDLALWRSNFGRTDGEGSFSTTLVPEPSIPGLTILFGIAFAARRRGFFSRSVSRRF